jgi:hypothetical protein
MPAQRISPGFTLSSLLGFHVGPEPVLVNEANAKTSRNDARALFRTVDPSRPSWGGFRQTCHVIGKAQQQQQQRFVLSIHADIQLSRAGRSVPI